MRKETLYDFAGREAEQVCLWCVRGGRDPILYTAHTSDLDSIFYMCNYWQCIYFSTTIIVA